MKRRNVVYLKLINSRILADIICKLDTRGLSIDFFFFFFNRGQVRTTLFRTFTIDGRIDFALSATGRRTFNEERQIQLRLFIRIITNILSSFKKKKKSRFKSRSFCFLSHLV